MSDTEYPIMTEDGKQFCRCRREGSQILLVTKNGAMPLRELAEQAMNPDIYRRSRGKKSSNSCKKAGSLLK